MLSNEIYTLNVYTNSMFYYLLYFMHLTLANMKYFMSVLR